MTVTMLLPSEDAWASDPRLPDIVDCALRQNREAGRGSAADPFIDDTAWGAWAIRRAAVRVQRRFVMSADDLEGAGWDWWWSHPGRRRGIWAMKAGESAEAYQKRTRGRFQLDAYAVARIALEQEIARRGGGGLEDADWMTPGVLKLLLPAVWDQDYAQWPPQRRGNGIPSGHIDPRESGVALWRAKTLTAQQGWRDAPLGGVLRETLELRFRDSWSEMRIAEFQGISDRQVRNRVKDALEIVCDEINRGPSPLLVDVEDVPVEQAAA